MIIHSPTISGSLIFAEGATFTLPDGGIYSGSFSGSLQVHEVTSHIIPDTNETYDLGSPTNRFRDIYLSNNTINFPGGAFGIGPSGDFTLEDANGDPAAVISKELKIADPVSGDVVVFKVVNGQLETSATDSNGTVIADPKSNLSGSFSGSFAIESVTTDILPADNEVQSLGSPTNRFAEVYLSNNSAKFPSGSFGMNDFGDFTLEDNDGAATSLITSVLKLKDTVTGTIYSITAANDIVEVSTDVSVSGDITLSGTVDGIDLQSFSSSLDSRVSTVQSEVDAILSSSDADKDSFAEIVTLINSVDTTNDNAFASFYTASIAADEVRDIRLGSLETFTSSIDSTIKTKLNTETVISGSSQVQIGSVTGFTSFSSSVDSRIESLDSNLDGNIKTKLNEENVISSSAQVTITESQISDLQSYVTIGSSQALSTGSDALTFASNILTLTRGDGSTDTVDLSAYLDEDSRSISSGVINNSTGVVTFTRDDASTFELDLSGLLDDTNIITSVAGKTGVVTLTTDDVSEGSTNQYFSEFRVKEKLNIEGVISSSDQITITESQISDLTHFEFSDLPSGTVSGSSQVDYFSLSNLPSGIVSSSNQVTLSHLDSDDLSEGSVNLYFSELRVKEKMNIEGVISGSSQLTINEAQIVDLNHFTVSDLPSGTVSGSSQVQIGEVTGFTDFSSSVANTFGGLSTDYNDLQNIPSGIISSSEQLSADFLDTLGDGVVSGSSQIDIEQTTNYNVFSSSLKSTDDAQDVRLDNLELFSSSLDGDYATDQQLSDAIDTLSGSLLTTISGLDTDDVAEGSNLYYTDIRVKTKMDSDGVVSGSSQVSFDGITNKPTLVSGSSQINADETEGWVADVKTQLNANTVISGSSQVTITQSQISDVTATAEEINKLDGVTASTTEINYLSGVTSGIQSQISSLTGGTGSYVDLTSEQTINGTKTFNDIVVNGTGSFAYISSVSGTAKIIGDAFIVLNNDTPTERYAGISVYDSGSANTTASFQFDGSTNDWFYEYNDGAIDYGVVLFGPEYSTKGAPTYPTNNTIQKGNGSHHLLDSNITDNGSTITLGSNTNVIGSLTATTFVGMISGSSQINHDDTTGFVANEHIDWTVDQGATNIHTGNYVNTTYSVGNGGLTEINFTSARSSKLDGIAAGATNVTNNNQLTNGAGYITSFDITTQTDGKYLRSDANDSASGIITLSNSTASTSKTTGALVVTGGVGVSGALNVGGDVVAYASSDRRLKDNIVNIENPIEKVQKLNGVTWDWNGNADELQQSLPNVGVIAQEVEEVFPQLVHDRENGYKGVDYAKLTGLLIEAVKEQQKQIDELKARLG